MKLICLFALAWMGPVTASATPVSLENGPYSAGGCEYYAENVVSNGTLFTHFYCEITDTWKVTSDRTYQRTDDFHFQSIAPKFVIDAKIIAKWNSVCKDWVKDHHTCGVLYQLREDGHGGLLSQVGDEFYETNFIEIMNPQAFREYAHYRWMRNGQIISEDNAKGDVRFKKNPVCH